MKKITKLFLVILSAASFTLSAVAGELSVTGGVTATYKLNGADAAAGKGLGVSNELDFNASGDLDNGMSWKWQTQLDDSGTVNDDTRLELGTSYGTIGIYISENDISSKLGYGIGALGVGSDYTGPSTVEWGTTMNSYNNFGYVSPAGLLPFGAVVKAAYSPNLSNAAGASAKVDGAIEPKAVGDDATAYNITLSPIDGLTVGADYMTVAGGDNTIRYEQESAGAFAKYVSGPFTIGYAKTGYQPTEDLSGAVTTATINYETDMYGIQFAVNDALTLSWSEEKSTKHTSSKLSAIAGRTAATDVDMSITHIQAAYVIGGATVGVAIADADDADYTAGKQEKTTTFQIAMAF